MDKTARNDDPGAAAASLRVRCACGWELPGPEDAVVEATIEHGQRLHNMVATREDVLAMALPAEPPA